MNNDNEKDFLDVNSEETEDVIADAADESADETTSDAADEACEPVDESTDIPSDKSECECGCCCGCGEDNAEDLVASYYTPAEDVAKPKRSVVTPVIIAAAAFVLVAALVFGGVFLYNTFFGTSLEGVWVEQGYEESGIYFDFDDEGNVYLHGGGISYYGTYETATYDTSKDAELPDIITNISAVESLEGKVNVLKTDFYIFGMYGGEYIYTTGNENGVKSVTLKYLDSTGAVNQWAFYESELPEFSYDASVITNASADEAGVTELSIDDKILGTWNEVDYGTYTFYADGTANYISNYQIDQTYAMFYGITMGYGVDLDFKYTVGDGVIYMTVDYYTGETNDGIITYYVDGNNLVLDGVGYAKVTE